MSPWVLFYLVWIIKIHSNGQSWLIRYHSIFPVWFNMLADLDKQDLDFGQGTTISKVRLAHEPMAMFDVTLSIRQAMDMDPCSLENDEASIGGLKLNLTYKADALAKRKWQNNYRSTKRCSFE